MNRVELVGRITKTPELKQSTSGVAYCYFSIAVKRPVAPQNGGPDSDFINCVVFGKQAENLCRYVQQGGLIGVEGRLQSRKTTNPDGSNVYSMDVCVDRVEFLGSKQGQTQQPQTQGYNQPQQPYNDFGSYSQPQNYNQPYQPQQREQGYRNQQQPQTQGFNQQPQTGYQQPRQQSQNNNDFGDVDGQYSINDDDLPF